MNDSVREDARKARAEVQTGALRAAALMARLLEVPFRDRDGWADELLGLPELPSDEPNLPRGSVPYLPAEVDDVLTMVREAPLRAEDVFVDIGSGLGRVVMLAHLLSGARAHGVEIQRELVEAAERCAARLRLDGVSFEGADAAGADLEGSVFFLYTPFGGAALAAVMARLREVARRRPIVVCAVGFELEPGPWLVRRPQASPAVTLYDSRP